MPYYRYFILTLLFFSCSLSFADGAPWANFASREGTILFLSLGTVLPLTEGGRGSDDRALRVADTLAVTAFLSDSVKHVVHETRPDGSDEKSFPSMHTATAFSVAAMQAEYHPDQAVWWYLGAALIGASRVEKRKHYLHDTLAGAALGYAVARLELDQPHGFLFSPWIDDRSPAPSFAFLPATSAPSVTPWLAAEEYGVQARWAF